MIGIRPRNPSEPQTSGIRPVNLQRDLGQLADLIETVFADTMDTSGRAAVREMRDISRLGMGARVLASLNEVALGMGMGFVWEHEGRVVGNVSIYKADWPRELGSASIIANVGTLPQFQNRGIAQKLMLTSMKTLYERGVDCAILQVETQNTAARHVYRKLGFVEERAFTLWRRGGFTRLPAPVSQPGAFIRSRRRAEWETEYALARLVRPLDYGGLGWQRPLHQGQFRRGFWRALLDVLNMRTLERLVICPVRGAPFVASLWLDHHFASRTQITLINDPMQDFALTETLLNSVVRRLARSVLVMEHPADDERVNGLLREYGFEPQRTTMHMRWDACPVELSLVT